MKIAVIADIHANYRALETALDHIDHWEPDHVIVAGDTVNRGPRSLCCQSLIEGKRLNEGWHVIRGNHEEYVIGRADADAVKNGPRFDILRPSQFTYEQLNRDVSTLLAWPETCTLPVEQVGEIQIHHASVLGNRDGIYPETSDQQLKQKISPAPDVFITGHTHRPLVRRVNGTLVVNAGSLGLPFDGDTRPAYAQITGHRNHWEAEIIRLKYDLAGAQRDFIDYGFMEQGGPLVELIYEELRSGIGQLYQWMTLYYKSVLDGETTVAEAAKDFMRNPVATPYWCKTSPETGARHQSSETSLTGLELD